MSLSELQKILKADQISSDSSALKKYGSDWTKQFVINPSYILFPTSTVEVQRIVVWARKNKISLVPSGGRTGLSGGAVAANSEVVISLERMNKIFEIDAVDRSIRCEAGVITETLQEAAIDAGFYFPVDFASRGSSQIGGNISTNAGGIKVIRYGLMRDWILGLTVVTGTGEILQLNRALLKDNTGYDLRQLFIGSEGTLGIITEATLKLAERPKEARVLLLSINKVSDTLDILQSFRRVLTLNAFEFFTDKALNEVLKSNSNLSSPFENRSAAYVLIEFEVSIDSEIDKAMEAFERCTENGWVVDGSLSQNSQQASEFWKYREDISESLSKYSPFKSDVSVRISQIPNFVRAVEDLLSKEFPTTEAIWFGHIGDGNLHINVIRSNDCSPDDFRLLCDRLSQRLFETLQSFSGSISAEHGIGLTKKPYLQFSRSPQEISLMREIKKVFDPDSILNPGKIFDS